MFQWRSAFAVAVLLTAVPTLSAAFAPGSSADGSCVRYDLEVLLEPLALERYHLAGWLCAANAYAGQTVILAQTTGLADHSYWDWPQEPETYSYVQDATRAGFAVFNYDRIGTGLSDRPPAAFVTLESEAYVAHQLVQALRAGSIGGTAFGKVVTLGNSFGTFISIMEAEIYRDVDGVINTGIFVGPQPQGLLELFAAFYPAQLDPKFANADLPLGYATTIPGSRTMLFHLPAADAVTVALDEELKETATLGEAATFSHWTPLTRTVDVPVLSVMGDRDFLFCRPACEQDGPEMERERTFWAPETCLEIVMLPETGHDIQLHARAALAFDAIAHDWLARRIGADPATPPTQPCGG